MTSCTKSPNTNRTPCQQCGVTPPELHKSGPLLRKRHYCPSCCVACVPTPEPPVASQWQDLGWGPSKNDPFYHDRDRRAEIDGKVPWLARRRR